MATVSLKNVQPDFDAAAEPGDSPKAHLQLREVGDLAGDLDHLERSKADVTGDIALMDQQISEKERLGAKLSRALEQLTLDRDLADQKLDATKAEIKKHRQILADLMTQSAAHSAKISSMQELMEQLEEGVRDKKEDCRLEIAAEMERLGTELEQLVSLKRQSRDAALQEMDREKIQIKSELETYKAEAWKRCRDEVQRFEDEMVKKKSEAEAQMRASLEEAEKRSREIVSSAEAVALSIHKTAEEKSRAMLEELEQERSDFRARSLEIENNLLREKNESTASLRAMELTAQLAAEKGLNEIRARKDEMIARAEMQAQEITDNAHRTAIDILKNAEVAALELKDREQAAATLRKVEHEESMRRTKAVMEEQGLSKIAQAEKKARGILSLANEQAQVISNSAQDDYRKRLGEADDAFIQTMREASRKAEVLLKEADGEALQIVTQARGRASNIEATIEGFLAEPRRIAQTFVEEAENQRTSILGQVEKAKQQLDLISQQKARIEGDIRRQLYENGGKVPERRFNFKIAALFAIAGLVTGVAIAKITSRQLPKAATGGAVSKP